LQVDPVLTNRPANADPYHIRDQANWLDPTVELDSNVTRQQIDSRLRQHILPWAGWEFLVDTGGQVQRSHFLAEAPGTSGEHRPVVSVHGGTLKLKKNHVLTPQDQWLVVDAVRTQTPGPPCKLVAKIGAAMPVEWDLPVYDKNQSDFRPLIVSLAEFHREKQASIAVELHQLPTAERVPVLWRAVAFTDQHPRFFRLLEDSSSGSTTPPGANLVPDVGEVDPQQKYYGANSLRLPIGRAFQLSVQKPVAIRERPQLGEYRFLRFAVRKQGGGGMRVAVQHQAADRAAVYVAAKSPTEEPGLKKLSNQELPKDWQVFTRDLFGDFGNLDITGISFQFPDGEQAWIDHVYFASTQRDYDLIKSTLP
jgi:hypothetical protein